LRYSPERTFPIRVVAACFAMAGFSTAILSGLAAGREAVGILGSALVAMFACHVTGMLAGAALRVAVTERLGAYQSEHPVPRAHPEESTEHAQVEAAA